MLIALLLLLPLLSASSPNKALFNQDDYGVSTIKKWLSSRVKAGFDPNPYLKDAVHVESSEATGQNNGGYIYWIPKDNERLLDHVSIEKAIVPYLLDQKLGRFHQFFQPALICQYILPVWFGEKLDLRDIEIVRTLAPLFTMRLRKYFQLIAWAVYFQTGKFTRDSSDLTKSVNRTLSLLGFKFSQMTLIALNSNTYAKLKGEAPLRNVFLVSRMWGLNLRKITQGMPESTLIESMLNGSRKLPSLKWKQCLDLITTVLDVTEKCLPYIDAADGHDGEPIVATPVEDMSFRFPAALVKNVLKRKQQAPIMAEIVDEEEINMAVPPRKRPRLNEDSGEIEMNLEQDNFDADQEGAGLLLALSSPAQTPSGHHTYPAPQQGSEMFGTFIQAPPQLGIIQSTSRISPALLRVMKEEHDRQVMAHHQRMLHLMQPYQGRIPVQQTPPPRSWPDHLATGSPKS